MPDISYFHPLMQQATRTGRMPFAKPSPWRVLWSVVAVAIVGSAVGCALCVGAISTHNGTEPTPKGDYVGLVILDVTLWGPIENLPLHHDVGIGGKAFEPFDRGGGWNPTYDVRVPLPSTDFGSPSGPPSVPSLPPCGDASPT